MKNQIVTTAFVLFTFLSPAHSYYERVRPNYVLVEESGDSGRPDLSAYEEEYFQELNTARMNPKLYATYVRDMLEKFTNEFDFKDGGVLYRSFEGTRALHEAIEFLENQAPLKHELTLSKGLTLAAIDHVRDQGPKGLTGHNSSDGTGAAARASRYGTWLHTFGENISYTGQSPRGHVIGLIVDDGVPNRGHRRSVYNPAFKKAGVSCGQHKVYKIMCVLDLSGGYRDRTKLPGGVIEF